MSSDVEKGTMIYCSEHGRPWNFQLADAMPLNLEGKTFAEQIQQTLEAKPVLGSTYSLNAVKAVLANGESVKVPGTYAVVRDYDQKCLPGAVRERMTLQQPRKVFERLERIVEGSDNATITAAGFLRDGARMWACVKVGESNPTGRENDVCHRHVVFVTGFDGSLSTQVMVALTRAVCWNTIQLAAVEAKKEGNHVKVKNTINASERLDRAEETMRAALEQFGLIEKRVQRMANTGIKENQASDILDKMLGIKKNSDKPQTRKKDKKEKILSLYNGEGVGSEGLQGTVWGLHNAITEYYDHHSQVNGGVRSSQSSGAQSVVDACKILDSLWLGSIAKHKAAADELIDQFLESAETTKLENAVTLDDVGIDCDAFRG